MKKIKLDVAERLTLVTILDGFKGGLSLMSDILDSVKDVVLSEDEKKKINFRVEGKETQRYVWDIAKATEKEIELKDTVVEFVVQYIKEKDDKGEFTLSDTIVLSIQKKLK